MLPFSVLRIDHLVLRVQDTERSIAFYRDLLGAEVVKIYCSEPEGNAVALKGPDLP